jgi:hypothetical protein
MFDAMLEEIEDSIYSKNIRLKYLEAENRNSRLTKRKTKRLLNEIETENKYKEIFSNFKQMWVDFLEQENLKNEFVYDYIQGGCYDIVTPNGTVKFGDYGYFVDTIDIGQIDFTLFFPFTNERTKSKLVKVKTGENCISQDPDDCYIWCMKPVEEYSFTVYNGKKYWYTDCPENYEYEDESLRCVRTVSFNNKKQIIHIDLFKKNTTKKLKIVDWKNVNCDLR